MIRSNKPILALLFNDAYREAGESEINGKTICWDEGYFLTVVPLNQNRRGESRTYRVDPKAAKEIEKTLLDVFTGALIELEIQDKNVISVAVLENPFGEYAE